MAEGTGASPEQMAAFARSATDASTQLNSVFTNLNNQLATLEAQSKGRFANAFTQVKQTVATESGNMHQALNSIAASVGTAGANYSQGDEEMGSAMDQVQGSASGITSGLTRA